ncbi:hypothetical protein [Streptomyces sp. NPDC058486]|uniref:hypothetical protein n=1 Tax=unclassified Streptomyces TaxID=2593676 RepID=UPI003647E76E
MKGEIILPIDLTVGPNRVFCDDPTWDALARDEFDVLWVVTAGKPSGTAAYAEELHSEQQRTAMESRLCAGCKGEPSRNRDGMLWILPLLDYADDTRWAGVETVVPPMCHDCADDAKLRCPRLREGYAELRVQEAELIGVIGTLYPRPGEAGEPDPDKLVLFESSDLAYVVARQLVCRLDKVTVITVGGMAS